MAKIVFDPTKEFENSYKMDGEYFVIQNNRVFKHTDEGYVYDKTVTADELRFYGEIAIERPKVYELKILEIKANAFDNSALIHAEDGADFDFWFYDANYKANKDRYRVGELCKLCLFAEILSCELPENFRDGVCLEGEDAQKWFNWVEDEVEEDTGAIVPFHEIASFSESADFASTGIYEFNATVNDPAYTDEASEAQPEMFLISAMNQYNKKYPRFMRAFFAFAPYTFPEFEDDDGDDGDGLFEDGWALKGTLRFIPSSGMNTESEQNILYEYGKNPVTFAEDKGLFAHEEGKPWFDDGFDIGDYGEDEDEYDDEEDEYDDEEDDDGEDEDIEFGGLVRLGFDEDYEEDDDEEDDEDDEE